MITIPQLKERLQSYLVAQVESLAKTNPMRYGNTLI